MELNSFSPSDYMNSYRIPLDRLSSAEQIVVAERLEREGKDQVAYEVALTIAKSLTTESTMAPKEFVATVVKHAHVNPEIATAVLLELSSRQVITYTLGGGLSRGVALE